MEHLDSIITFYDIKLLPGVHYTYTSNLKLDCVPSGLQTYINPKLTRTFDIYRIRNFKFRSFYFHVSKDEVLPFRYENIMFNLIVI